MPRKAGDRMASISTSIELYDRVSAPINKMIGAMQKMCDAFDSIDSAMGKSFDTSRINEARRAVDLAAQQMSQVENEIQNNKNHQENFNNSVKNGKSVADGLLRKIGGIAAAYASIQGISKVMGLSDTMAQTTARLNLMKAEGEDVAVIQEKIFQAAERSRGSYQESADAVAKMGIMAKDAFNSTDELIGFVEQLNKQFTIAGTSQEGVSAAMLQLTQAMSSGVLRGEELNSVFEQAPTIIQTVADYMNVPIGKIREMAAEGQLTAEIVKNAMLSGAAETNAKFEKMPKTWGQILTSLKNQALMAFQPILQKINEIVNSESFQIFVQKAVNALYWLSSVAMEVFKVIIEMANFVAENWSIIGPIIMGVVAALIVYKSALAITKLQQDLQTTSTIAQTTATTTQTAATAAQTTAQHGLNAALFACPIVWIIMAVIAAAVAFAIWTEQIMGAIFWFGALWVNAAKVLANILVAVWNTIVNIGKWFMNLAKSIAAVFYNVGAGIANFFIAIYKVCEAVAMNIFSAFNNAWIWIQQSFWRLVDGIMQGLKSVAEFANTCLGWLGVNIDTSSFDFAKDKISELDAQYKEMKDIGGAWEEGINTFEYKDVGLAWDQNGIDWSGGWSSGMNTFDAFSEGWGSDAYNAGAGVGKGIHDSLFGMFNNFSGLGSPKDYSMGYDVPAFNSGLLGGSDGSGISGGSGRVPTDISKIASDTGAIKDSMDITSEDLKYLRDIAERDVINRFTTAEIKVEMTNNNTVSSDADLDGIVDYLVTGVNEAMEKAAEGVHV